MPNAQQANLIVLGHTGAGKSSFINYLIGENLLKTGRGEPITQHFDSYTADKAFGLPTRIYDSKGLEVAEYQEMSDEIIRFIQEKCEKEDIYQWIHAVFYCINRTKARLDDSELNLIRRIQNETLRTVHVVLTNCDGSSEDEPIKNYVQESLGKNTPIYCVSSVAEKTRRGTTYQFGKEAIIEGIFKVLWQDILRVIAKTTAKQFYQFFDMSMEEFFELLKIKIAEKDREFEDENILIKFMFSKEIEKRRENEFIKITGGLLKRKIDAIKTYNHAIAYKSQNELDSFAQFFNRYGVANHFHVNKTAICNVANKISETLENAANRLEKKYAKGKAGDAADIYYIISTQIFHQGAIMGLFTWFLIGLLNEPISCNQFCKQIVGLVKNEFPTESKLESLLLKNMLDLRVEKTLQTPN